MKRSFLLIYVALCLVLCAIPAVGMLVMPSEEPVGNEQKVTLPSLTNEDGSFNISYLSQLGNYFEHNFAFRSQIITADALVQSRLFGVSNIDSVVVGNNGWLFYASTLDDFTGTNMLTEHQAQGIVHNLELIQQRVEEEGAQFLFAIAPNKNTLYPSYMPAHYRALRADESSRDVLLAALQKSAVHYCNLFELLSAQDEVLYHATDSHWDNRGALLAANAMLDALNKKHNDYAQATPVQRDDFVGDLAKMIYPASPGTETEYYFGVEDTYTYVTDTKSVEESLIKTASVQGDGILYMYRDSFGNALLPYFASAFSEAQFTKTFPMMLDINLQSLHPSEVVFEIAERNVSWFLEKPPIMEAPRINYAGKIHAAGAPSIQLTAEECPYSPLYLQISGPLPPSVKDAASPLYIFVADSDGNGSIYECFDYVLEDGQDGFLAYIKSAEYQGNSELTVSVMIKNNTGFNVVGSKSVVVGGN